MPTPEQLASLAQSLKDNEVFQAALAYIRANALENLAVVPASNIEAIQTNQATVRVVDEFYAYVEARISAGKPRNAPGIA